VALVSGADLGARVRGMHDSSSWGLVNRKFGGELVFAVVELPYVESCVLAAVKGERQECLSHGERRGIAACPAGKDTRHSCARTVQN
jgi:hypothetical protein